MDHRCHVAVVVFGALHSVFGAAPHRWLVHVRPPPLAIDGLVRG